MSFTRVALLYMIGVVAIVCPILWPVLALILLVLFLRRQAKRERPLILPSPDAAPTIMPRRLNQ